MTTATKPASVVAGADYARRTVLSGYIQLTKPSIMLLVLYTGATALIWEGSLLTDPVRFLLVLVGLYLAGGSANALNQYFERDIDARMSRTSRRRPLPLGQVSPGRALAFALVLGVLGVALFALFFNPLTAALALATILFYGLYYTLWLKPHTPLNIVIGGVAGAMAPVGAWTAATGHMDLVPWTLFLIVFLWTPPHFWSLALMCKDDYRQVNLPMLPLVKGDRATLRKVLQYTVVLVPVSFSLLPLGSGLIYVSVAAPLGATYIYRALTAYRSPSELRVRGLFTYSLLYLFGLFSAIIADRLFFGPLF